MMEILVKKGKFKGKTYKTYILNKDADRNISDMFDSIAGGAFRDQYNGIIGHGSTYYRKSNAKQLENFANLFSNWSRGGKVWRDTQTMYPNMTAEFEKMMKEFIDEL